MAKKADTFEVVVKTKFKDAKAKKKLRRVGDKFKVTEDRYNEIVAAGEKTGVTYVEKVEAAE